MTAPEPDAELVACCKTCGCVVFWRPGQGWYDPRAVTAENAGTVCVVSLEPHVVVREQDAA